ncbi:hydrolase [Agrococcus sp. SL85]|uniref:hydrolase n=1 Tax=Agrococcus sp. SL85 TaxID=2995141 RepID=UPI00226D0E4B|nr:hydrolase [Agrococcus sp. SL85]WAC66596.1 hydrolase [Agrococcus sp. SL85]
MSGRRWSDAPVCATCGVEQAEPLPETCRICADERQWVPGSGQAWTSLDALTATREIRVEELEPGLWGLTSEPAVGIGQRAILVPGDLLWDPLGVVTEAAVERVRQLGGARRIVASHPHMHGAQVAWAEALGARVLVHEADAEWLQRDHELVERWSGSRELAPGLALHTLGGHFPGAAVAIWAAGSGGLGSMLAGDTIQPKPDRRHVAFMRSYPNHLPLSHRVVRRIADAAAGLRYRRLYGNIPGQLIEDGPEAVERSAVRHIRWVLGDFDHLT